MLDAIPGQVLDFSNVRPKLLLSKPMKKADEARLLSAMAKIREADARKEPPSAKEGPYDDVYANEMPVESFGDVVGSFIIEFPHLEKK